MSFLLVVLWGGSGGRSPPAIRGDETFLSTTDSKTNPCALTREPPLPYLLPSVGSGGKGFTNLCEGTYALYINSPARAPTKNKKTGLPRPGPQSTAIHSHPKPLLTNFLIHLHGPSSYYTSGTVEIRVPACPCKSVNVKKHLIKDVGIQWKSMKSYENQCNSTHARPNTVRTLAINALHNST